MNNNTYVFFRNDQREQHFEFTPNCNALDDVEYKYFGRVLSELEPRIQNMGLTIYVTAWTVHELPSYGPNVISCILQDEWGREPQYRNKVGMVFKTCGRSPFIKEAYGHGGLYDRISNALGQSKAYLNDKGGRTKTLCSRIKSKTIAPVHDIPIGCFAYEDIPFIPFEDRENDVFFAGSIRHLNNKLISIKRPKELARDRMSNALKVLQNNESDLKIKTTITQNFADSITDKTYAYLQTMMNTKICPIPRGANLETFRFYEAIRYGCIPIGEAFPDQWFYKGAPIIRLKHWSDATKVIPELINNPSRMNELHEQALSWWNEKCSEQNLAHFMQQEIKKHYS